MTTTKEATLVDIEAGIHQVRGLLEDVLWKQDENMTSLSEQSELIQETITNFNVIRTYLKNTRRMLYTTGDTNSCSTESLFNVYVLLDWLPAPAFSFTVFIYQVLYILQLVYFVALHIKKKNL
jgi:hypothetical protein